VDDVLGHVVLAGGDEDLLAGDAGRLPSSCGSALVRIRPRSVPQWGSVRFMVPVHSQDTILGSHRWLSVRRAVGEDRRGRAVGQALIHGEGLLAAENISPTAVFIR
jgi:hypothetical protein